MAVFSSLLGFFKWCVHYSKYYYNTYQVCWYYTNGGYVRAYNGGFAPRWWDDLTDDNNGSGSYCCNLIANPFGLPFLIIASGIMVIYIIIDLIILMPYFIYRLINAVKYFTAYACESIKTRMKCVAEKVMNTGTSIRSTGRKFFKKAGNLYNKVPPFSTISRALRSASFRFFLSSN